MESLKRHTKQSNCETGLLLPGWLISHTLTQPLPPVYTYLVGLLIVTAQTTSPWFRVLICRAWRGMPDPINASGGKGTGWTWPSALTWNEYAGFPPGIKPGALRPGWVSYPGTYEKRIDSIKMPNYGFNSYQSSRIWIQRRIDIIVKKSLWISGCGHTQVGR